MSQSDFDLVINFPDNVCMAHNYAGIGFWNQAVFHSVNQFMAWLWFWEENGRTPTFCCLFFGPAQDKFSGREIVYWLNRDLGKFHRLLLVRLKSNKPKPIFVNSDRTD